MSAHTTAATLPVALHALTGHMLAHHLPAPHDIDARDLSHGIQLWLHANEAPAWLNADFTETHRATAPLRDSQSWESVRADGRIATPIGDVRVQLTWVQMVTRPALMAVSS